MTAPHTLLLVTYHFPPSAASGSFRMLGFTRHLPKFGWNVSVVAPPSIPWEPVDPKLAAQVPPETTVFHAPYTRPPLSAPFRTAAPYSWWLPSARGAVRRAVQAGRPDVLMTSGPPHTVHVFGLLMKRRYGLPWVADFRDPWVLTADAASVRTTRKRVTSALERAVMKNADLIVLNAPGARAALQDAYPEYADKMVSVTNGYDPELFQAVPPAAPSDGPITIVHPGQIYGGRDPRPFLDAVRAAEDARRAGTGAAFHVRLIGQTERAYLDLEREIQGRGLEQAVSLIGQVSYAEALREMCQAGVLLLLDTVGRKIGVPAKLYEYVGAGRPVLALAEPDGDLAWVLRESGVTYRIAPPDDPAAIHRALAELAAVIKAGPTERPSGPEGEKFSRESLARDLAERLDLCMASSRGAGRAGQPEVAVASRP